MSLGTGAYKNGGARQCFVMKRRYLWQPCERPPPGTVTLNNSVKYLLTNTYLALPSTGREGGREGGRDGRDGRDGRNQSTNWHSNSKLFAKNCKQATGYTSHEVPLLEALGHPQYSWKTADQHCFKINFA